MLEFNPLYYKKKRVQKYHLIFLFCNFIKVFFAFQRWRMKEDALRKEPHSCSRMGRGKKALFPKICHTYPTMMKTQLWHSYALPKEDPKYI